MSNNENVRFRRGPTKWRKVAIASSLVVAGAAGGAFAQAAGGHAWGPGGRGGEAMMERGMERLLGGVDATPQQREKIGGIVRAARSDLVPLRASFGDTRAQFVGLMTADAIDRAAAERLRADRIGAADAASRRMLTAALDAAEVLTPEQRGKLKSRFDARVRGN